MGYYTTNGGLIGVGNITQKKGVFDIVASMLNMGFEFDDAAYSQFFTSGASPIDVDNSSYDQFIGSGSAGYSGNATDALDNFVDHNQGHIWRGYSAAGYYTWNNAGNNYSGNANFYAVNSAALPLTGNTTSGMSSNGRGMTIAYLGDGTPVIVISTRLKQFYYFNYPTGTYIGKLTAIEDSGDNPTDDDFSGLCFSGTQLLVATRVNNYVYGYDMPENTAAINDTTVSVTRRWSTSHDCQYGMAWSGDGVYMTNGASTQNCSYFRFSGTGTSGTSTQVRTYSLGVINYSLAVDYKNRKLIMGGYSNNRLRVWGE